MSDIKIYYSASNLGFYHNTFNEYLPEDVTEISSNDYKVLLNGQSKGKIIVPDENGYPILKDVEVSPRDKILNEIYDLENLVSERRRREAISGDYNSVTYITEINNKIAKLRLELRAIKD